MFIKFWYPFNSQDGANPPFQETPDMSTLTTFNLELTDSQKRSKDEMLLPHFVAQRPDDSKMIVYCPGVEDDIDDEDPDLDLEF